jgi:acetylornithine/N-succinyldiaminopimelate aminotransferase
MAGIAVNALGHANPKLVQAVKDQAEKLWHVSNIFTIPGQEKLAKVLTDLTFADEVFFTNSGAEAVECAIKTARKYHWARGNPERIDIIGFDGSFHGRTMAAVNASGNASYLEGFGPRMPGFVQVPYGDHEALKAAIGPTTAAIIIEPVQGEGGARALPDACLRGLRQLCDDNGILLILDEIQCGLSRTGKLFAYEWAGIEPDIMAVAKALGGGFPVGACLATAEAAQGMVVGSHGSTYGGNPLGCAVGAKVVEIIADDAFLSDVSRRAAQFRQGLEGLVAAHPQVFAAVRGQGLMLGLKCSATNTDVVKAAYGQHLLTVPAADNVIRILPALTITEADIAEALARLDRAATAVEQAA